MKLTIFYKIKIAIISMYNAIFHRANKKVSINRKNGNNEITVVDCKIKKVTVKKHDKNEN